MHLKIFALCLIMALAAASKGVGCQLAYSREVQQNFRARLQFILSLGLCEMYDKYSCWSLGPGWSQQHTACLAEPESGVCLPGLDAS